MNKIIELKKEFDIKSMNIDKSIVPHYETIAFDMHMITRYCQSFPTCEKCDFNQKYSGCFFRNKTPREW